jgi:ribosome-binding protein aMBF1 (putative translation factor)
MALVDHSFGKRVREAREVRGMFQQDVVDAIAALGLRRPLSLKTLQRIESGKYHRYTSRMKAQILRILPELR